MGLLWALFIALMLDRVRGEKFFQSIFFLPTVTSSVAIGLFFTWIFQADYGLVNSMLRVLHIDGPNWLGTKEWSMLTVAVVVVWSGTGYWMVVFLAALKSLPVEILEAARIDGANEFTIIRRIKMPLITPTIFYYLTNALITAWYQFELVYTMTPNGGPESSTLLPSAYIFDQGFVQLSMGYASAMAWSMNLVILLITVVHFKLSNRWVNYER